MKDKTLIRLQLPIAGRGCDVKLPLDEKLNAILPSLISLLESNYSQVIPVQRTPMLWNARNGIPLASDKTLREQEIKDSDLLFLV